MVGRDPYERPSFTLGVEEEYMVIDPETRELRSHLEFELLSKGRAVLEEQMKPAVVIREAPEALENEDLIEMVNAGLVPAIVVDQHGVVLLRHRCNDQVGDGLAMQSGLKHGLLQVDRVGQRRVGGLEPHALVAEVGLESAVVVWVTCRVQDLEFDDRAGSQDSRDGHGFEDSAGVVVTPR